MCDDVTEAENEAYLERITLSRRDVGIGAGAVTLAAMLPGCKSSPTSVEPAESAAAAPPSEPAPAAAVAPPVASEAQAPPAAAPAEGSVETASRRVVVDTPDGKAEAFFVAPKSGKHPGVLMWPDIAGLREAFTTMATRLASAGYAVLAVNHYYRSTKLPVLANFAEWRTEAGKAKITPMKDALTPERISKDGAAFVAWLDQQPEVDKAKKLASNGYCMTGSYTFRTAAAAPARVGVVASFHGGGLVTNEPTSPHTLLAKIKAAALICIAQSDDEREPETKTTLKKAAEAAHLAAEIEVYPAQHGWCVLDAPVYDQTQAERAWARMIATFERYL